MTCKDCIHRETCFYVEVSNDELDGVNVAYDEEAEILCDGFADRSKFIELPCKVGDKIYKICPLSHGLQYGDMWDGKIVEIPCQRCGWEKCDCHDIGYHKGCDNIVQELEAKDLVYIVRRMPYFGEIYFTNKKEAEQALRERKNETR